MANTADEIADVIVVTYQEQALSPDELRRLIADAIREERGEPR